MSFLRKLAIICGIPAIIAGAAACSGVHHLSAKVQCGLAYHKWQKATGKAEELSLKSTALGVIHADAAVAQAPSDKVLWQAVDAKTTLFNNAVLAALHGKPIPNCVPGAAADVHAALLQWHSAVSDQLAASEAAQHQKLTAAQASLKAALAKIEAGANDLQKVGKDAEKYARS